MPCSLLSFADSFLSPRMISSRVRYRFCSATRNRKHSRIAIDIPTISQNIQQLIVITVCPENAKMLQAVRRKTCYDEVPRPTPNSLCCWLSSSVSGSCFFGCFVGGFFTMPETRFDAMMPQAMRKGSLL